MQGLNNNEAKIRLDRDGPNELTPQAKTPEWVKFLKQMFSGFQALLWIGSILCFIAYFLLIATYDVPPADNVRSLQFGDFNNDFNISEEKISLKSFV